MQEKKITNTQATSKFFNLKTAPSTLVAIRYSSIALIITLILMFIIPKILNYGPETINTPFDVQMSYISYSTQFLILAIVIILGIILLTKFSLKDVDNWYKDLSKEKLFDSERIQTVRRKCLTLPYLFFALEILVPFVCASLLLSITGSHSPIMIAKILLLLISFAILLAVVSFIFSKNLYDEILSMTYIEGFDIGMRINLRQRIFLLIFPIIVASIFLIALIGYSAGVIEKEDVLFSAYNTYIYNFFDKNQSYTSDEIYSITRSLIPLNPTDSIFVITPDKTVDVVLGNDISNFVLEYTLQISDKYNGRIYDSYGVDTQGASIKLNTPEGTYYVGILYDVYAETSFEYLCITGIFLIITCIIILYIFGNSLSKSITKIHEGFQKISDQSSSVSLLPAISNDEIGDLVLAFNDIQKINETQLHTIQNNQSMLIEKERLASLGQMIGGIAHNLKTPIFSISGGLEGLNDLIDEYDSSIEDPNVNDDDMHAIAQDMRNWVNKLKNHISYMSDVITAVKGQAVTLSDEDVFNFTIEELFKQVDILMKHELNSALITLNISNNVSNDYFIKGNINSLVQIINNIISNAIEAYGIEAQKSIDLSANMDEDKIIIEIKDYASGIPLDVQNRLFKEMITTKGKNGTGLGLFMSYSTIKAHFQGDITFVSELEKGTIFYITLPIAD